MSPSKVKCIPFSIKMIKSCLTTTLISYPVTFRKHRTRDSGAPRLMFFVYGFELLVGLCLVHRRMMIVHRCVYYNRIKKDEDRG
jgi:hypothetical protein